MPASVGVNELPDGRYLASEFVVDGRFTGDLVARVENRGMVAPAELCADSKQRYVRLLAHEEHRDLARHDDALVALLAAQRVHLDAVVVRDRLGDALRRYLSLLWVVEHVRQDGLGQLDRDRRRAHRRERDDSVERSFELANV